MKSKRENKDYVLLFLKGVGMGLANKIPGVSGGIIAIVTGFYEELLFSFQRLNLRAIILLLKLTLKPCRDEVVMRLESTIIF